MKFKLLFLLWMLLLQTSAIAYDFEVDGMYYNIIGNNSASITYKNQNYNTYSGNLTIPETIKYNNRLFYVTEIGHSAFKDCSELINIQIPHSVTSIGNLAFQNCSRLTHVSIPSSVVSIGGGAFLGCSLLATIDVPNTIESINGNAFYGTAWYNNQPSGLIYAGLVAYEYKGTMPSETDIIIKEGTIAIASNAFESCDGLRTICIPNTVKLIGNGAFYGCNKLSDVIIPNSVTTIGDDAFAGCNRLSYISFPESLKKIGAGAFRYCSNLSSINIPNTVTSIGRFAFDDTRWYDSQPNGLVYAGSVVYKYKGYLPNGISIEIPEGTMGIAGSAFYNCNGLSHISLPNSLNIIGDYAFYGCNKLSSIIIPNSVTSIGDYSFYGCGITNVVLSNSITSILKNTFTGCNNLREVHINDLGAWCNIEFEDYDSNPLYYAHHLYMNGTLVKDLVVPDTVTSISKWAFSNCSSLASVYIPSSVTSICDYAFYLCDALTTINIPNSISFIGDYAFSYCDNLSSVNFPNTISSIGTGAFYGCYNLNTVSIIGNGEWSAGDLRTDYTEDYYNQSLSSLYLGSEITSVRGMKVNPSVIYCFSSRPPICDNNSFNGFSGTLHVPASSLIDYFSAPYWENFANLVGDAINPMDISISLDSVELNTGDFYELTAIVSPEMTSLSDLLIWSSTNPNIAAVSNGTIHACGAGECDIIVTCIDKCAVCHVIVKNKICLDKHEAWLFPNQILTLTPTAPSSVITNLNVSSSDETVAVARIVNERIQVLSLKEGRSTITVFSNDDLAVPDSCLITVYSNSCDVNGDGEINVSDINEIIKSILNNEYNNLSCDINGDGEINIADINFIISVILKMS